MISLGFAIFLVAFGATVYGGFRAKGLHPVDVFLLLFAIVFSSIIGLRSLYLMRDSAESSIIPAFSQRVEMILKPDNVSNNSDITEPLPDNTPIFKELCKSLALQVIVCIVLWGAHCVFHRCFLSSKEQSDEPLQDGPPDETPESANPAEQEKPH